MKTKSVTCTTHSHFFLYFFFLYGRREIWIKYNPAPNMLSISKIICISPIVRSSEFFFFWKYCEKVLPCYDKEFYNLTMYLMWKKIIFFKPEAFESQLAFLGSCQEHIVKYLFLLVFSIFFIYLYTSVACLHYLVLMLL